MSDNELQSYDAPSPALPVNGLSDQVNLFGSSNPTRSDMHTPMFDFDFPVTLVESSTPGHYHVYLGRQISWRHYREIMDAMRRAGLLQYGWVNSALKTGQATLRPPHVFKDNHYDTLLNHIAHE